MVERVWMGVRELVGVKEYNIFIPKKIIINKKNNNSNNNNIKNISKITIKIKTKAKILLFL